MTPTKPVAIVGMGCRLPGASNDPEALWNLLLQGRNCYSKSPSDRLHLKSYQHPSRKLGTTISAGGHFLDCDITAFDAPFFGISPSDAKGMDPQQRLMLEVVYEALENAGLPMDSMTDSDTSCFVGCFTHDWNEHLARDPEAAPKYAATGIGSGMIANRVSWFFNWHGPSLTLDTACSSSLVALHLACQSIHSGESKVAVAAGSNLILSPALNVFLSSMNFLAPDGKSKSFDSSADGYGRGEGLGVVVLKSLDDAIRDGDCIRAVIRGTGVNQDGHTSGITLPSAEAQVSLIQSVYRRAGLDFSDTSYFEAHGTGTTAGDAVEMRAIGSCITRDRNPEDTLYVGSIKSNIGHTEGTAGIAGLIKTVMMLEKGLIPPSVNLKTLNPKIPFDKYCLKIPQRVTPWSTVGIKRASISSFGYGGTNAHAILDEAAGYLKIAGLKGRHGTTTDLDEGTGSVRSSGEESGYLVDAGSLPDESMSRSSASSMDFRVPLQHKLLVFSAHDERALVDMKEQHLEYIRQYEKRTIQHPNMLSKLACCLSERRSKLPWKSYTLVTNSGESTEVMDLPDARPRRSLAKPRLGYVFTGQGAQWAGMGQELLSYPVFEQSVQAADAHLQNELGCQWSVKEELARESETSMLHLAKYSQPICTILQIALVDLLESWGVKPSAVVGHSSGEIAAAVCAGIISREKGWQVAYWRGLLSSEIKTRQPTLRGAMLAVGITVDRAQELINSLSTVGKAQIACINSPESLTLSGDEDAISELETRVKSSSQFARRLRVENAYHSHHMKSIAGDYLARIRDCEADVSSTPKVRMLSSVTGKEIDGSKLRPVYWVDNLTSPVQFSAALSSLLRGESKRRRRGEAAVDMLLEVGPHSALLGPFKQVLKAESLKTVTYGSVLRRGKDAVFTALQAVGLLHATGFSVNITAANQIEDQKSTHVQLTDLPKYPWNHERSYWSETRLSKASRLRAGGHVDLLGAPCEDVVSGDPSWRQFLRTSDLPWIRDHKIQSSILYPAAGMVCMAVEAARQTADPNAVVDYIELRDVRLERPMVITDDDQGLETKLELLRPKTNSLAQDWVEFRISSSSNSEVLEHNCSGFVAIRYKPSSSSNETIARERTYAMTSFQEELKAIEKLCKKSIKTADFYAKTESLGLQYGPAFQNLTQVRHNEASACGTVVIYDTKATIPSHYQDAHLLHPSTLDCMIQLIFAAVGGASGEDENGGAVPIYIQNLKIASNGAREPGCSLRGYTKAAVSGMTEYSADIVFGDDLGTAPFVSMTGLKCRRIGSREDEAPSAVVRQRYGHLRTLPDLRIASSAGLHRFIASQTSSNPVANQNKHAVAQSILELIAHINPYANCLEIHETGPSLVFETLKTSERQRHLRLMRWTVASLDDEVGELLKSDSAGPLSSRVTFKLVEDGKMGADDSFDAIIMTGKRGVDSIEKLAAVVKSSAVLIFISSHWQDAETFKDSCSAAGLNKHIHIPADDSNHLIISRTSKPHASLTDQTSVSLLLPDSPSFECMALANELTQQVERLGLTVSKFQLGSGYADKMPSSFCVSLLALESHLELEDSSEDFESFKKLLLKNRRVLWVTGSPAPHHQTVHGIFRTVRNEHPDLDIASITLSSASLDEVEQNSGLISQVLFAECEDKEFVAKDGLCHISRFSANDELNHHIASQIDRSSTQLMRIGDIPVGLELAIRQPGLLDTMWFRADRNAPRELLEDEVEFEPRSVGVNFRDLMILLGQLSDSSIGFEAGGIIKRVGSNVNRLKPGDRVYALREGCFRTLHYAKASLVHPIPSNLSFSEAASLPVIFITALACLRDFAKLKRGETILIHAAAGGVGQAAIQLAQHYGATILATVGSSPKAQMLQDTYGIPASHILSSRDSSFVSGVKRLTGGRGVDVVLNSLSGELLRQSWQCLAPSGRFVEIGIKDINSNSSLDMAPFINNATFSFFNLSYMNRNLTDETAVLMRDVHNLLLKKVIKPIQTITEYPLGNILHAMRSLQAGKHSGKLVVTVAPTDTLPVHPSMASSLSLKSDATYVIAGGLGGLGRSLAAYMAESGAKNIVFLSRSGTSDPKAAGVEKELRKKGTRALFYGCDITDATQLKSTLDKCARTLPPIAGCVQSAMVLRDGILETMTHSMYADSVKPKVSGSWNLHELLPEKLDFFILLSSISGITGNPGQANYAAGNTFMDSLAHFRRSKGLPAISLDLGLMLDVGFVAERQGTSNLKKWESVGLGEAEFRALMGAAMSGRVPALPSSTSVDTQYYAIPGQVITGLATGGHVADHSLQEPFYFSDPRFKQLVLAELNGDAASRHDKHGGSSAIRDSIKAATCLVQAVQAVSEAVGAKLAQIMDSDASNIDVSKAIHAYGVDSLLAVELRNWIVKELQCELSLFDLLRSASIQDLAKDILQTSKLAPVFTTE